MKSRGGWNPTGSMRSYEVGSGKVPSVLDDTQSVHYFRRCQVELLVCGSPEGYRLSRRVEDQGASKPRSGNVSLVPDGGCGRQDRVRVCSSVARKGARRAAKPVWHPCQ